MQDEEHGQKRFDAAARAAEWDVRYSESGTAMWSGRPNGRLVAEVAGLSRGRALDVGCGEGADAICLAGRGWTVATLTSPRLPCRAREAAGEAGVGVGWICGDALQIPFPPRSFDLVSMQYPALPKAAGEPALRMLLDTVRPGGLLLAVYHDLDDEHREHKSCGDDPADYVGADDLGLQLSDLFIVELTRLTANLPAPWLPPYRRHCSAHSASFNTRRLCGRPAVESAHGLTTDICLALRPSDADFDRLGGAEPGRKQTRSFAAGRAR